MAEILHIYPEINPEWLLTGKGPMLRSVEVKGEASQSLKEPQAVYGKPREAAYEQSCLSCQDKEKVIQGLEGQLEEVRHRLADKDKQNEALERQIEDLKTNLERVIASKDEMLTLYKEQLEELKAKLEEPKSKAFIENMRQSA